MPISEKMLIAPALVLMYNSPNGEITTSALKREIAQSFPLDKHDMELLQGRADEKYTQIVRNLKSHKSLKNRFLAEEIKDGFRITEEGKQWLLDNNFV